MEGITKKPVKYGEKSKLNPNSQPLTLVIVWDIFNNVTYLDQNVAMKIARANTLPFSQYTELF